MAEVKARVAVVPTGGNVEAAVREAMERGGVLAKARGTVFVKPNFTFPRPLPGVTTSLAVLEAALGALKDKASRVIVGEADGGYASFTARESFAGHGLEAICRRTGAEALNLSEGERSVVEDVVLGKRVSVHVRKDLLGRVDLGVSVPVMKAHAIHRISLGTKNLWGCDADTMRLLRRKHLSRRLALLARTLRVESVVVDATTALDRYGPMAGDPVRLDTVIAGNTLAGTDAATARLMGYDPAKLDVIRTAARAGLGPIDAADIEVLHEGPTPLRKFRLERTYRDYLALATFHNATLAKVVYDSRLTPVIYKALGKTPRKKLQ